MSNIDGKSSVTFDQLSQQQLVIYARELQEHVQEQRRLRRDLEKRNGELEQRVREIEALNRMFQSHLKERYELADSYQRLSYKLTSVAQGFRAVMRDEREQEADTQLVGAERVLQRLCDQFTNLAVESQLILQEAGGEKPHAAIYATD